MNKDLLQEGLVILSIDWIDLVLYIRKEGNKKKESEYYVILSLILRSRARFEFHARFWMRERSEGSSFRQLSHSSRCFSFALEVASRSSFIFDVRSYLHRTNAWQWIYVHIEIYLLKYEYLTAPFYPGIDIIGSNLFLTYCYFVPYSILQAYIKKEKMLSHHEISSG